ncbi:MAG: contact-dependent growth inhibition system immunity protein [Pseudomonadota bacterium]
MSKQTVDCRKLAQALTAQRSAADPDMVAMLRSRFGIDAALTLTEIEGIDFGDAVEWGDLPDLHALRYVPLSHFSAADVELMLVHRESVGLMAPMARLLLEASPLLAAQNFEGDLLLALAACVAGEAFDAPVQVPTPFTKDTKPDGADWALDLINAAEQQLWTEFARAADGRNEKEFAQAKRIVSWGPPLVDTPWFSSFDDVMNTIAEARAWMVPPRVRARAVVNALYVVPRNGRLQIVTPETFEQLEETAEHSFQRATVFEIVTPRDTEVPGLDLVTRAVSSIEDWRGTRVPDIDAGIQTAMDLFGLPPALWDELDETDTAPLNHFELEQV